MVTNVGAEIVSQPWRISLQNEGKSLAHNLRLLYWQRLIFAIVVPIGRSTILL
ncbi:MAG: hypothetical protein WBA89_05780 [Microcoleus sp.]|uniref:hypothetical protein n=1 Tax=Microcoleus sp. TaxID=44472 RepID=UPI003C73FE76